MNSEAYHYIRARIENANEAKQQEKFLLAWDLLEEAHILSQPFPSLHTAVHWTMFCLALRQGSAREIVGQAIRLVLAAPGSFTKRYPIGNTGRSNVSMFRPMPTSGAIEKKMRDLGI